MTWSIIARDKATGCFGIAVATRFFAVGAQVPFIAAGIGAVATQALAAFLGPSLGNAMIAIGVTTTPIFVRLTRGQVMAVKVEEYVEAARRAQSARNLIFLSVILQTGTPGLTA